MIKKGLIVLFTVMMGMFVYAQELPKTSFGTYGGEMPAYEVYVDGQPISISPHDVYISLFADKVVYRSEHIGLVGTYSVFKQNKNEFVVKAQLSNGKSINYEMEFTWNKKEDRIFLSARNGQAAAILERISS